MHFFFSYFEVDIAPVSENPKTTRIVGNLIGILNENKIELNVVNR